MQIKSKRRTGLDVAKKVGCAWVRAPALSAGFGWSATIFDLPNLSVQTTYQPDCNTDRWGRTCWEKRRNDQKHVPVEVWYLYRRI